MPGRIIVIDSIATNRMALKTRLASEYYDVDLFEDSKSAWASILQTAPDAVLVNCKLPDANGYAVCAKIKSHPETGHIPVILIAASEAEVSWSKAYSSYADDIHRLPLDFPLLAPRLQSLIRAKASLDELRLRNKTNEDLGLAEPRSYLREVSLRRVSVALVGGSADQRHKVGDSLRQILGADVLDLGRDYSAVFDLGQETLLVFDDTADGDAALRLMARLRTGRDGRFLSVMYLGATDKNGPGRCERALSMGAIDAVSGPIEAHALAGRVRAVNNHSMLTNMLCDTMSNTLKLVMIDPLTGLYNRRYALQYLTKALDRACKSEQNLFVMMMDMDNFKSINDRFGHPVGDKVLKAVADQLQNNLRGIDLVARIGGEEFMIVIADVPLARALGIAERIRTAVSETNVFAGTNVGRVQVTASIGIARANRNPSGEDALIEAADRALYISKRNGRDRVTYGDAA